jgi:hypothetical protein
MYKNNCNTICAKCSSQFDPRFTCTNCEDGPVCEEIYYSSCVVYTDDCLNCYGVQQGDNLTTVIIKLLEYAFPECTEVTTTTTTLCPCTDTTTTSTTTVYTICDVCP